MICAFSIIFVVNKDIALFKILGTVDHFSNFLVGVCGNKVLNGMLVKGTIWVHSELWLITPGSPPDGPLGNILKCKDSFSCYATFFDSCVEENRHELITIVVSTIKFKHQSIQLLKALTKNNYENEIFIDQIVTSFIMTTSKRLILD